MRLERPGRKENETGRKKRDTVERMEGETGGRRETGRKGKR